MVESTTYTQLSAIEEHACASRYVIVIEKDAIFQRLVDDGFAELVGAILVTAKGMPDMATRAFLHSLTTALPFLKPFAGNVVQLLRVASMTVHITFGIPCVLA